MEADWYSDGAWDEALDVVERSNLPQDQKNTFRAIYDYRKSAVPADLPPVEIDYESAKPVEGTGFPAERGQRRAAQREAYLAEALGALSSETRQLFQKLFLPYRTKIRQQDGVLNVNFVAFSPDKVLGNAALALREANSKGRADLVPYENRNGQFTDAGAKQFGEDLGVFTRNQAHGYSGMGDPITVPPGYEGQLPQVDPNYTPTILDEGRANFINLTMGIEPPRTGRKAGREVNPRTGLPITRPAGLEGQLLAGAQGRPLSEFPFAQQPYTDKRGREKGGFEFQGNRVPILEPNPLRQQFSELGIELDRVLSEVTEEINLENIKGEPIPRPRSQFRSPSVGLTTAGLMPRGVDGVQAALAAPPEAFANLPGSLTSEAARLGRSIIGNEAAIAQLEAGIAPITAEIQRMIETGNPEQMQQAIYMAGKTQFLREAAETARGEKSMANIFEQSPELMVDPEGIRQSPTLKADIDAIKQPNGSEGTTINSDGTPYVVPEGAKLDLVTLASENIPLSELTAEKVAQAADRWQQVLANQNTKLGIFKFEGPDGTPMVSIDLNVLADQQFRENTLEFGRRNNQIAAFDLTTYQTIPTDGTGETVLKSIDELAEAARNVSEGKPYPFGREGSAPPSGALMLPRMRRGFSSFRRPQLTGRTGAPRPVPGNVFQRSPMLDQPVSGARSEAGKALEAKGWVITENEGSSGPYELSVKIRDGEKEVGEIIATVPNPAEDRTSWSIDSVIVQPEYRRQGVSEALYRELANRLQDAGATDLKGWVVNPFALRGREKALGIDKVTRREMPSGETTDVTVDEARQALEEQTAPGADLNKFSGILAVSRIDPNAVYLPRDADDAAAAVQKGIPTIDDSATRSFTPRTKPEPKKTVKAYKLFRAEGGKLYPLFVDANVEVPQGQWLDATEGPRDESGTGVKSRLRRLAFRPGWHAGDLPLATHIGPMGPDGDRLRRANEVWAEVEMAADVDYQERARQNGLNPRTGRVNPVRADLKEMPVDGFYRFKTSPTMDGQWLIGGAMKVNKILTEAEVNSILEEAGKKPMAWEGGQLDLEKLGLMLPLVNELPKRSKLRKRLEDSAVWDPVYHFTKASEPFENFITDNAGFGAHFGTPEAALIRGAEFLEGLSSTEDPRGKGYRTIPVYLDIKKPYRLTDQGAWSLSELDQTQEKNAQRLANWIFEDYRKGEFEPLLDGFDVEPDLTLDRSEVIEMLAEQDVDLEVVQQTLRSRGYDGIVYKNRFEGVKDEETGRVLNIRESMERRNANAEVVFSGDDGLFEDGLGVIAEDSYIVFEPEQVISPFGEGGAFLPRAVRFADGTIETLKKGEPDWQFRNRMEQAGRSLEDAEWGFQREDKSFVSTDDYLAEIGKVEADTEPEALPAARDAKGKLQNTAGGTMRLVHLSSREGLRQLDPAMIGRGRAHSRDMQGLNKTFFFERGSPIGGDAGTFPGGEARYLAQVDGNAIYDVTKGDPQKWLSTPNRETADQRLVDAGYQGVRVKTADGRRVVMMFTPVPVELGGKFKGGGRVFMPRNVDPATVDTLLDVAPSGPAPEVVQWLNSALKVAQFQEDAKSAKQKWPETLPLKPLRDKDGNPVFLRGAVVPETYPYDFEGQAMVRRLRRELGKSKAAKDKAIDAIAEKGGQAVTDAMDLAPVKEGLEWYSKARTLLSEKFGQDSDLFAQLLAATSPQQPPIPNFLDAFEIYQRYRSGELDTALRRYEEILAEWEKAEAQQPGETLKAANERRQQYWQSKAAPVEKATGKKGVTKREIQNWILDQEGILPRRRATGAQFGISSRAALDAIAGRWLEVGQGKKTRQFYGNLSGQSFGATIDVWAARWLHRLLNEGETDKPWRIPPLAERGVADADFDFAQQVFERIASRNNLQTDTLQALLWFWEKDTWDKRGWTRGAGAQKQSFIPLLERVKGEPGRLSLTPEDIKAVEEAARATQAKKPAKKPLEDMQLDLGV